MWFVIKNDLIKLLDKITAVIQRTLFIRSMQRSCFVMLLLRYVRLHYFYLHFLLDFQICGPLSRIYIPKYVLFLTNR